MSKSLSLILSAALFFGAVSQTGAVPLARKASTSVAESEFTRKVGPIDPRKPVLPELRTPGTSSGFSSGLKKDYSGITLKKQRAVRSATAGRRAVSQNVDLRGIVVYSDFVGNGLYQVPKTSDGEFNLIGSVDRQYLYGLDNGEGRFYGGFVYSMMGYNFPYMDIYDMSQWRKINSMRTEDFSIIATTAALDPVSGEVYGSYYQADGGSMVWARADYETLSSTPIAPLEEGLCAVGVTKDGQYYAVTASQKLVKIDKETGAFTMVAQTEAESPYACGGCVNDADNTFLMTFSSDEGGGLYEIDLATGAT